VKGFSFTTLGRLPASALLSRCGFRGLAICFVPSSIRRGRSFTYFLPHSVLVIITWYHCRESANVRSWSGVYFTTLPVCKPYRDYWNDKLMNGECQLIWKEEDRGIFEV
jgi:hypothetical protein